MSESIVCWKCGADLEEVLRPFSRLASCPTCEADLHVCRQCEFHDTGYAKECREPVADEVNIKDRANFCGYFVPRPDAFRAEDDAAAAAARDRLQALFGIGGAGGTAAAARSREDAAREDLERLFGIKDGGER